MNSYCYVFSLVYWEKAMAPHSSTLAWKIPWMEEPGRLQSMGSLRVGHSWVTSLSLFTFMHWRRKWQPTLVFLPGESQGWGSLVGCRLWGRTRVGHDWSNLAAAAAAEGIFVSNQGFYCVCQPCGKRVAKTLSGSLLLIFFYKFNYTECKVFPECLIHF